jgi:SRSO17 transposase
MERRDTGDRTEDLAAVAPRRGGGDRGERPGDDAAAEDDGGGVRAWRDPRRWGLSAEAVASLGERLYAFWPRVRSCFTTRTRDPSAHAYDYLRGPLTMDTQRNFAHMARTISGGDGQALQPLMSNSPWSGPAVFAQMQAEITATPALAQGGTLILAESADAKAGTHHVGASRQYNGRLGKVDICRVDTCLIYAHGGGGTMGDGELFLPEEWLGEEWAARRQALGIPEDRTFETKLELGLKMVKRVKAHGLPFDLVACDAFYGRDSHVRAALEAEGVRYAAQVPADTLVYVSEPQVGVPQKRTKKGRPRTRRAGIGHSTLSPGWRWCWAI